MKFSTIFSGSTLLATLALAAPSDFLGRRHTPNILPRDVAAGPTVYNNIWAGAVIEQPPTGTFTKVSGQFVLPEAFKPSGSQSGTQYAAAFWVGIGADPLLQAGVDSIVTADGKHEYSAWYEWYPEPSGTLSGLDLAAGDKIEVVIETASPSSKGNMTVHNLTKNKKASKTLAAPSGGNHGDMTANWIVEDYTVGNSNVAFADFKKATFTNCVAHTSGGTYTLNKAHPDDIKQNGKILTKTTIDSNSEFTVKYVG